MNIKNKHACKYLKTMQKRVNTLRFFYQGKKLFLCRSREVQSCAAADRDKPLSHTAIKAAEEKINFK